MLAKDKLLDAIMSVGHFGERKLYVQGNLIMMDEEVIGYCLALSKAYQMKSVAYPDVDTIIYDEFLLEDRNGRYLPNEPNKVLALMETVGRLREVRLLMLGNYASRANIYFDYWKLFPKPNAIFTKHPTKPVLIHLYANTLFREVKGQTPFAKLIEDTPYGGYILDNNPIHDNYTFVEPLNVPVVYWFGIYWQGLKIGVQYQDNEGIVWFTDKIDPSAKQRFSFDTDSHQPNMLLLKSSRTHPLLKQMRYAIDTGMVRFTNLGIKNAILELLQYL
jgi:hypothetical protein